MNYDKSLVPLQSAHGDGRETALVDYASACRRRVWLIVAIAVGVAGVAAAWSFMQEQVGCKTTETTGRTTFLQNTFRLSLS
jgi:hypothetical protein